MQAQSDEIDRCASSEAQHHVWTKERKSHDNGKQMHNSSSVQGGWWMECSAYVWGVGKTYRILAGKSKRK